MLFWFILGSAAISVAALGVLAAIWGIGIERHLRVIRSEKQELAVLPQGSQPIRILHISDFHLAPWQRRKLNWISKLGKLDVDLVVDTGDNLGHPQAIQPTLAAMASLGTKPGVYVNGSNDYFAPMARNPLSYLKAPSERISNIRIDTEHLTAGLDGFGWLNLNNRGGHLTIKGVRLGFLGVDDAHDGLAEYGSVSRSKIAMATPDVWIGVSHAPYLAAIDAMNEAGVSVLFAGHTHGGQVCVPGLGALVTNCDLPRKYAKGLSKWVRNGHTMWLNVCAGLGHSIYAPVRFACRPEVRIVTLTAKA